MKDWSITKELALDRRVGASNPCVRTLTLGSSSFIVLLFFFILFVLCCLLGVSVFYCLSPFFLFGFLLPFLFLLCFGLSFSSPMSFISNLRQLAWD
jgi:hypothetical protein